jgi:PAS domain S-box-containing protein
MDSPAEADLLKYIEELEESKADLERRLDIAEAHLKKSEQHYQEEIATRIRLENDLRRVADRYETLISQIPGVVFCCENDAAWTMDFISEMIEEMTGHPAADFINNNVRTFASIMHHDDIMPVMIAINDAVDKHDRYRVQYRLLHKNGSIRHVIEVGKGSYSINGDLRWIHGVIFDITGRKGYEYPED